MATESEQLPQDQDSPQDANEEARRLLELEILRRQTDIAERAGSFLQAPDPWPNPPGPGDADKKDDDAQ